MTNYTPSVQEITRFLTTDGTEHENLQRARAHQNMLDVKDAFEKYQDGRPGGMSKSGFFDFLARNRDLVMSYLARIEVE